MATGLFKILEVLPPQVSSKACGHIAALVGPLTKRHSIARRNLKLIFPQKTDRDRKPILKGMWRNIGRTVGEYPHLEKIIHDRGYVRLVGMEAVQVALEGHHAAFLLSAHYGNWEVTSAAGQSIGLVQANLYRKLKDPLVDSVMRGYRQPTAPGGFIEKGDGNIQTTVRFLKRGTSIGMLVDQREMRGIQAPFLGRPAYTVHAPALIARRLGVPVFVGRAHRTGELEFTVECRHVPVPVTDDPQSDVTSVTRAINDIFSEWIYEYPDQWLWTHDRWKTRSRHASG
jgi:KDO2-lipid IV(A) lauroyltransferase